MIKILNLILFISYFQFLSAQNKSYKDSISAYQLNYVNTHEAVSKNDRKFITFSDINESYRVTAHFEKLIDKEGFEMNTSSGKKSKYFKYGLLTFKLHDSLLYLFVYQSESLMHQEKLKDYLFVPFGDATSGFESYGGGRYLDFFVSDIKANKLIIDFNKAYNPYCAYAPGFNCPLPPAENILKISIPVGEKNFLKSLH